MLNLFLVCVSDIYYKNTIFNLNSPLNRDNYWYPYYLLRELCHKSNISLNTYDYLYDKADKNIKLLFFDIPKNFNEYLKIHSEIDKYLVIWECSVVNANNWNKENHSHFKKIFTWHDDYVDGIKYIKYYWPNKLPENMEFEFKKDKLCCMIAGNKYFRHPLELYSERIKATRFFEENHPGDFDLYGIGWNEYYFRRPLTRLNRIGFLKKICAPYYPSYRGKIESKKSILSRYKFSICYENARDIPGYITEKIFDSFFACCIPIYWGSNNIHNYIDKRCFIDKRNFKSYEELYKYFKSMSNSEYISYLDAIKNFIKSDKMYLFSGENFADTLIKENGNEKSFID